MNKNEQVGKRYKMEQQDEEKEEEKAVAESSLDDAAPNPKNDLERPARNLKHTRHRHYKDKQINKKSNLKRDDDDNNTGEFLEEMEVEAPPSALSSSLLSGTAGIDPDDDDAAAAATNLVLQQQEEKLKLRQQMQQQQQTLKQKKPPPSANTGNRGTGSSQRQQQQEQQQDGDTGTARLTGFARRMDSLRKDQITVSNSHQEVPSVQPGAFHVRGIDYAVTEYPYDNIIHHHDSTVSNSDNASGLPRTSTRSTTSDFSSPPFHPYQDQRGSHDSNSVHTSDALHASGNISASGASSFLDATGVVVAAVALGDDDDDDDDDDDESDDDTAINDAIIAQNVTPLPFDDIAVTGGAIGGGGEKSFWTRRIGRIVIFSIILVVCLIGLAVGLIVGLVPTSSRNEDSIVDAPNVTLNGTTMAPSIAASSNPSAVPSTSLVPSLFPSSSPSTTMPSIAALNPIRLDPLIEFLSAFLPDASLLEQSGSPQRFALEWLASNPRIDEYSNQTILQRYALATLIYATSRNPASPWVPLEALKDVPECDPVWAPCPTCSGEEWCDRDGRIQDINLSGRRDLDGMIAPEISVLAPSLRSITISNSNFRGTLPTEIGLMTRLEDLVISNNQFSGTIPTEFALMRRLSLVHMTGNNITGTVPEGICELRQIRLHTFETDCLEKVSCSCCTDCN